MLGVLKLIEVNMKCLGICKIDLSQIVPVDEYEADKALPSSALAKVKTLPEVT